MIGRIALLVVSVGVVIFFTKRILRYLRFFQQEEYYGGRFVSWLFKAKTFDRRGTTVCLVAALWSWCLPGESNSLLIAFVGAVFLGLLAYGEPDPLTTGKVRLNLTERSNRIVRTASIEFVLLESLGTVLWSAVSLLYGIENPSMWWWLIQIPIIQATPFSLITANLFLAPHEAKVQAGFLEDAKKRVKNVQPFVIGITGSYGKTSTKMALGEMLKVALGSSFVPPKSYNTLMGNVREVRERLVPGTKYAVMEMGAYGVGSIKRLTELTPPQAAIVTAVGIMHLERYGTAENVFKAKSELAQALPKDGILVCNGDNEGARRMAATYPSGKTLLYGLDASKGGLACHTTITSESEKGTEFTILWNGKNYKGTTKLLGEPAISNLTGAFLMAAELGADPGVLLGVIRNLAPVDNRLSIDRRDGVVYIRDAYNSNPVGFRAALKVLKNVTGQQRILMTPGMIELGHKQYEENEAVGAEAAGIVTKAIVVGETNKKALLAGLKRGGLGDVEWYSTRTEALVRVSEVAKSGDAVLIENDLTDLYEVREEF